MSLISRSPRFQAILVILLAISPLVFVAGTNYIVDPLQIYRQQRWVEPRFWTDQRSQNAGKIRSYLARDGYDSIILGNSVADNFRPSRVAEVMGWKKTMKLTVDGGQASEQAYMLEQALTHGQIRHVLWCIRISNFIGEAAQAWHPNHSIPFYLYTSSVHDDAPYLLSQDIFAFSRKTILNEGDWQKDLDSLNYWQSKKRHIETQLRYNDRGNLKKFRDQRIGSGCSLKVDVNHQRPYTLLENNLIQKIRKYPDVEFIILFAPETRQSAVTKEQPYLSRYFGVQHYLVRKTERFPNAKVFGFDNDDRIVNNLANYRDSHHFHSGVNEYMLSAVARSNNQLTSANFDTYIAEIKDKLCRFKVQSDFKTMIPFALQNENEALQQALSAQAATEYSEQVKTVMKE